MSSVAVYVRMWYSVIRKANVYSFFFIVDTSFLTLWTNNDPLSRLRTLAF